MVQVKKKISQLFQREAATNCTKTAEGTFRNHGVTAGVDFTRGSASLGDDWGGVNFKGNGEITRELSEFEFAVLFPAFRVCD